MLVNNSSNIKGSIIKILLERDIILTSEVAVTIKISTSNNQVEYKGCLYELHITFEIGAGKVVSNQTHN